LKRSYLRSAAVAPFGVFPGRSLEDLVRPAIVAAVSGAGLAPGDIDAVVGGSYSSGVLTAQRAIRGLGLSARPVLNVENACASSASAAGYAAAVVRGGGARHVLVLGVEQLSRSSLRRGVERGSSPLGPAESRTGSGLVPLNDDDPDVRIGLIMPAVYAMRARRYLHEFGTTPEQLASVSVKNRGNGSLNACARFRQPVTADAVLCSRMIAEPLTLLQCCAGGDGAAALVVSAEPGPGPAVRFAGSAESAGLETSDPRDMARSALTASVARRAYEEAGIGPEELDVVELHDAFTICELIYTEALGLCGPGEASGLLESGDTALDGRVAVNPSGGLLARGHPVGATGAAQLAEIFVQLRGEAGRRQRGFRRVGLTHTTGGGISGYDHAACAVHVLVRDPGE
jgi:acetyl-CoA acetyltransferase